MADWNVNSPADSDLLSLFPANERAARAAVRTNFAVDHYEINDANIGRHKQVTLLAKTTNPAPVTGAGVLFTKSVDSELRLFFISNTGVVTDLIASDGGGSGGGGGGDVFLDADNVFTGNNTFNNDITMAGELVGFRGVPLITQNSAYTYSLADRGKGRMKSVTSAITYTIPANATVAFPPGTILVAVNQNGTGDLTLAGASGVTLMLAGTATSGARTVAPWGWATALKTSTNTWLVNGPGVA